MSSSSRYKIIVKTLQGKILVFSVDEYEVVDGLITFIDEKTLKKKRFSILNVEVEEHDRY